MTTTLGKPLVVKILSDQCDGRCGGTIHLATDGVSLATTYTDETDWERGWLRTAWSTETTVEVNTETGTITGYCQSSHDRSEEPCCGTATFDRDTLAAAEWVAATDYLDLLTPMDRS